MSDSWSGFGQQASRLPELRRPRRVQKRRTSTVYRDFAINNTVVVRPLERWTVVLHQRLAHCAKERFTVGDVEEGHTNVAPDKEVHSSIGVHGRLAA